MTINDALPIKAGRAISYFRFRVRLRLPLTRGLFTFH